MASRLYLVGPKIEALFPAAVFELHVKQRIITMLLGLCASTAFQPEELQQQVTLFRAAVQSVLDVKGQADISFVTKKFEQ